MKMKKAEDIVIEKLKIDEKDFNRADNLQFRCGSFYGSGAPWTSEASKMAKLIKDPVKLAKRTIAVVARWGTGEHTGWSAGVPKSENAFAPFRSRLYEMGFSCDQIDAIIIRGLEIGQTREYLGLA